MEQHVEGCVDCVLPEILKSQPDVIPKGVLQLKQNSPETAGWKARVCVMHEGSYRQQWTLLF